MKALIIVDVQNDFLPGGALEVTHGDEVIDVINRLQSKYEIVVATQDWHTANHKSFASMHVEHNVFDVIDLNGYPQTLWPNHCVQGSVGAEFSSLLNTDAIQAVFRKGMDRNVDSYSGFFDNNKSRKTGLHGFFQDKSVNEVHICGLAADFCVYFTAMDALELGYKTAIISKATKAIDKDTYMKKKEVFLQKGGLFI
ncbi:bifunctional nicotinamidase/pyrazinamidase [Sphingobacterium bovistauri]|uniref:nicotinamidase n=1 Tax=Sphingobacterium bovistauri TaxID=2781959 RepID=A0ABS7Z665_9SPHI|nr:bifunctional nicotinamidase/pyrazinamidase [Sphingobacterium bovistauri]MCA5005685.1 bifunctional nicotinamidase/pyrazinamidase [Sphingobacterium bovistauri]